MGDGGCAILGVATVRSAAFGRKRIGLEGMLKVEVIERGLEGDGAVLRTVRF